MRLSKDFPIQISPTRMQRFNNPRLLSILPFHLPIHISSMVFRRNIITLRTSPFPLLSLILHPQSLSTLGIRRVMTSTANVLVMVAISARCLPANKCRLRGPARWGFPRSEIPPNRMSLKNVSNGGIQKKNGRSRRKRRETRTGSASSAPTMLRIARRSVNCSKSR